MGCIECSKEKEPCQATRHGHLLVGVTVIGLIILIGVIFDDSTKN